MLYLFFYFLIRRMYNGLFRKKESVNRSLKKTHVSSDSFIYLSSFFVSLHTLFMNFFTYHYGKTAFYFVAILPFYNKKFGLNSRELGIENLPKIRFGNSVFLRKHEKDAFRKQELVFYKANSARPFARLRAITRLPFLDFERLRNPWLFFRFRR